MKLIIDIDEELYKNVVEHTKNGYIGSDIWIAVANGKPLPKGHGRLIDASVLKDKVASWLKPEKPDETEMISLDNALVSTIIEIEEAKTIVEADKESSNEDSN